LGCAAFFLGSICFSVGLAFEWSLLTTGGVLTALGGLAFLGFLLCWTMCPACGDYFWSDYGAVNSNEGLMVIRPRPFRLGGGLFCCTHCKFDLRRAS
jgi:hypothetical protein